MKQFFRSLFGLDSAPKRMVVGSSLGNLSLEAKQLDYVKDSVARLTSLHELYKRYMGTAHENKLKAVWEKTKKIHHYLLARNRLHELELFHLQNTDHFITTFRVILDVRQQQGRPPKEIAAMVSASAAPLEQAQRPQPARKRQNGSPRPELIKPLNRKAVFFMPEEAKREAPMLSLPQVSINTYAKIPYLLEDAVPGPELLEIGHTSSPQEKEVFLRYVSRQLGIQEVSYVGNALVNIPNESGSRPTGMVPILHWGGYLYALNLNDFRLFPVSQQRSRT